MLDRIASLEEKRAEAQADGNAQRTLIYTLALGQARLEAGESSEALPYLNEAVDQATRIKNHGGRAIALALLGDALRANGEPRRARDAYDHALEANIPTATARAAYGLGQMDQNTDVAWHWYEKALSASEQVKGDPLNFSIRIALGEAALGAAKITRAVEVTEQALEQAETPAERYEAQLLFGRIQVERRRYEEALYLLEGVYAAAPGEMSTKASTLLISVYRTLDMRDKIREMLDEQVRANTDPHATMQMRISLAEELSGDGDYTTALDYLTKARSAAQHLDDIRAEIDIVKQMAEMYHASGFGYMALDHYEEAAAFAEQLKDMTLQAEMLLALAKLYLDLGEPAKAYDATTRAMRPAQVAASPTLKGRIGLVAAKAMYGQGDTPAAQKELQQVVNTLPREAKALRREAEEYLNVW